MSEAIGHAEARRTRTRITRSGSSGTYVFSTDHKMIGKQFLAHGARRCSSLGGILALLVRWQLAWPETAGAGHRLGARADHVRRHHPARVLQRVLHHARHDHDLLRGHADPGRVLRQLPHPAHDRRARHGLPAAEHALVLDRAARPASSCSSSFFVEGGAAAGGWTSYRAALRRCRPTPASTWGRTSGASA